ncbi:MAG: PorV/PorQ family protein [Gemmatimonadetes bacterium]|nr:PorV/PorQ family protein [Gemmatimonadota bacterium]
MRKLWRRIGLGSFVAMLLFAAYIPVEAQDTGDLPPILQGREEGFSFIGNTGGEFLTIPVGARGVAMGQAFTAAVDDISGLWWNPAGLGFMRSPAAFFTNINLPLDVQYNYAGVGAPVFGGNGVVAASFGLLTTDEATVTTVEQPLGSAQTFESWSSSIQGSYAHNISDRFTAGATFKWAHENIFGLTSNAYQFDFGTNYHTTFAGRGIRLAFVVQNIGTNFKSEGSRLSVAARPPEFPTFPNAGNLPLEFRTEEFRPPTTLKTALAYYVIENESSTFLVNGEFAAPRQLETTYSIGGEWAQVLVPANNGGIATTVAARAGYHYQNDEENLGDSPNGGDALRGLGFGAGLQFDFNAFGTGFDYAYRDWGRLPGTNNFSVSVLF